MKILVTPTSLQPGKNEEALKPLREFADELVFNETGKPLSELASIMTVLPQALVNAKVANDKKDHYLDYPEVAQACKDLEDRFAGRGRVLIRPSGTEPLVRVMIEGEDQEQIKEEAQKLADEQCRDCLVKGGLQGFGIEQGLQRHGQQ